MQEFLYSSDYFYGSESGSNRFLIGTGAFLLGTIVVAFVLRRLINTFELAERHTSVGLFAAYVEIFWIFAFATSADQLPPSPAGEPGSPGAWRRRLPALGAASGRLPRQLRRVGRRVTADLRDRFATLAGGVRLLVVAGLMPMLLFCIVFMVARGTEWGVAELIRQVRGPVDSQVGSAFLPWFDLVEGASYTVLLVGLIVSSGTCRPRPKSAAAGGCTAFARSISATSSRLLPTAVTTNRRPWSSVRLALEMELRSWRGGPREAHHQEHVVGDDRIVERPGQRFGALHLRDHQVTGAQCDLGPDRDGVDEVALAALAGLGA